MSSIKISNLPSQTTYTQSDIYPVVDYNFVQTSKMTLGQLFRNDTNVEEQPGQTNALNYANDAAAPFEFLRGTNYSSAVGATYESYVQNSYNSTVMGSIGSYIHDGSASNIIGGSGSYIIGAGNRNNIFGGTDHILDTAGNNNQIYGGLQHTINGTNYNTAIMAGVNNTIGSNMEKSVILGGLGNSMTTYGDISTIIGSQNCSSLGYKTWINGAEASHIYNDSRFSGLYGGYGNQINSSNTQGAVILNSWQSRMEGSGGERHIIINSDSCGITGSSYTTKHATIIGSTNSGIGANNERAILLGTDSRTPVYSATTHMENTYVWGHETHPNTVTTTVSNQQTFDADNGMVQYCDVSAGNLNLIFQNVKNGEMYRWVIDNTSGGSISLNSISVPVGFTSVQDTSGGSIVSGTHTFYITVINDLVVVGHYR